MKKFLFKLRLKILITVCLSHSVYIKETFFISVTNFFFGKDRGLLKSRILRHYLFDERISYFVPNFY